MGPVFLADVHLAPEAPERGRRFEAFLERLPAGTEVWVLGDLVDRWIEGRGYDTAGEAPAIRLLALHRARFVPGNRDFLAGSRFAAATGAEVVGDVAVVDVGGERVVATHGDLLCRRDIRYRAWRRIGRPALRALARAAPPAAARRIAARLSAWSAGEVARKGAAATDADPAAARDLLERHGATTLVAGHVHRPGIRDLGGGRRLVLVGHWAAGGEVAVRRGGDWVLVRPEEVAVP